MSVLNQEWQTAEKKVDPDFEGSIWQEMGYDNLLCPMCNAHLRGGICLNACHLTTVSREKFVRVMQIMARRSSSDDPAHSD